MGDDAMSRDNMDVGFLLKQINIALARNADQSFKPVTFSQMQVLVFLAHQPNNTCCQKAIESELVVSHPTVVGLLQRLEAKGLIATLTDEHDRRRKEICLTDAGRTVLQGASKHRKHMELQLCKGMTEDEHRLLYRLLLQMYQNVSESTAVPLQSSQKEGESKQHG